MSTQHKMRLTFYVQTFQYCLKCPNKTNKNKNGLFLKQHSYIHHGLAWSHTLVHTHIRTRTDIAHIKNKLSRVTHLMFLCLFVFVFRFFLVLFLKEIKCTVTF